MMFGTQIQIYFALKVTNDVRQIFVLFY